MTSRPNLVLAVVAGLVVILAVVVAIVSTTREAPRLDRTTPAGVVQLYIRALHQGHLEEATEYLDPNLGCTADNLASRYLAESLQLRVDRETIHGTTATVRLEIEENQSRDLLDGGWSHIETFELIEDADSWLITGSPWPVYRCEAERVRP